MWKIKQECLFSTWLVVCLFIWQKCNLHVIPATNFYSKNHCLICWEIYTTYCTRFNHALLVLWFTWELFSHSYCWLWQSEKLVAPHLAALFFSHTKSLTSLLWFLSLSCKKLTHTLHQGENQLCLVPGEKHICSTFLFSPHGSVFHCSMQLTYTKRLAFLPCKTHSTTWPITPLTTTCSN